MTRLVIVTFGLLGWAFYELSGGADFEPAVMRDAEAEVAATQAEEAELVSEEKAAVVTETEPDIPAPDETQSTSSVIASSALPVLQASLRNGTNNAPASAQGSLILPSAAPGLAGLTEGLAPDTTGLATTDPTAASDDGLPAELEPDVRQVTGSSVNMRNGPGTRYSIVGRMTRGTAMEVLDDPGNGWLKLRPVDGGPVGWMAAYLVSERSG